MYAVPCWVLRIQPTTVRIGRQLTCYRAVDLRRTEVSQIIKKETVFTHCSECYLSSLKEFTSQGIIVKKGTGAEGLCGKSEGKGSNGTRRWQELSRAVLSRHRNS